MRRKRITTATSVVAQAKVRAAETPDNTAALLIETGPPEKGNIVGALRARIDETPNAETGAPRLRVIIPNKNGPEIYDLTRLLVQPDLARFLAEGFLHWASTVRTRSRLNGCRCLNVGIGSFVTPNQEMAPSAINEGHWKSFVTWLNGPRSESGEPWVERSRAQMLGAVKNCIVALLDNPKYGATSTYLLEKSGFPHNPWPGRSNKNVPTAVLSPIERRALILACLSEMASLRNHLNERESILEAGRILLENYRRDGNAPPYRKEIGVCAARIIEAFPNRLASLIEIAELDYELGKAVKFHHQMLPVRRILYATFRDLVPFILLIALKTAFNPETILSLTWSQIKFSTDKRTITFLGIKNRAADLQVSITPSDKMGDRAFPAEPDAPFGLTGLLDLLKCMTMRTREILSNQEHLDRIFVAVPAWGSSKPKSYVDNYGSSYDITWKWSLSSFIEDHNLKRFNLAMLRASEGEAEWQRTGDLLAVRDRLGHKNVATTRAHYTSGGMRRESQERVAETQSLYHRWAKSEGRIDPRQQPEKCRSAATPGFGCLDPFHSPRLGQHMGKLCSAYGECPDCPLSQAWPQNVQAVSYYLALPEAINSARFGRISPKQWAKKWLPILTAHNRLLREIPLEVRADAMRFHIKLKPVG